MNYEQIVTFLAVISYGNITTAANNLYVSQSTVSSRLQSLEEELGAKLIVRNKGHRNIELTSYGNRFVHIAEQWAALYKDTQAIRFAENIQTLTIASVDAINNYTLMSLFEYLVKEYPNLKLKIQTHHSNEINHLVESRVADIGFVFSNINYPSVIAKPVFRELMYLVCQKDSDYYEGMKCSELDLEKEVYLNWGGDYLHWHMREFGDGHYPLITVNTGNMLGHYLHEKNRWAIAPMSVVQSMLGKDLVYYSLEEAPPARICYEIISRNPHAAQVETIHFFEDELEKYIQRNPSICRFEKWMLEE
ncbi:MAG: LysR family transcriptional regulator [Solobacterium sp.]|nr:LysR family transcriptional regulator [Solobacterium sp.]